MSRAGVSTQKVAAMWKAYKTHQTAFYVAKVCHISQHTARRYIELKNFAARFAKLHLKASEIADDSQAEALAQDLIKLGNIKSMLSDSILDALKKGELNPSISELDKIMRLMFFIRGEPDQRREELFNFSWIDESEEEAPDDSED